MSTFNTARISIGDRVRLAKVHHSHSPFIKAKLDQKGTVVGKGQAVALRHCVILFDGDEPGDTFMIANRYLEPLDTPS